MRERQREGGRERERKTDRQTDRQTERQTDRDRERQRETETQRDRDTEKRGCGKYSRNTKQRKAVIGFQNHAYTTANHSERANDFFLLMRVKE